MTTTKSTLTISVVVENGQAVVVIPSHSKPIEIIGPEEAVNSLRFKELNDHNRAA